MVSRHCNLCLHLHINMRVYGCTQAGEGNPLAAMNWFENEVFDRSKLPMNPEIPELLNHKPQTPSPKPEGAWQANH